MANLSHDPAHQSFDASDPHSVEHGHGGSIRTYVMVALALVFLTACSYWTYTPFWPFGDNVAIKRTWMMAVSCTKAMLVILFFMHLKWEANWKWVLTVPASMMSLLLVLALVPDVGRRMNYASRERLINAAQQPEREAAGKPGTALRPAEHPVGEKH
ncbi:MAG: cytochrome C oxidase subunit IV family protein [Planctomycetaceae bacterium]|nr:cytochrome C oxidase subunit IV family protein [Planctomycetaceae bacterium]